MPGLVRLAATLPEQHAGAIGGLAGRGPEVNRVPAAAVQAAELVARGEGLRHGGILAFGADRVGPAVMEPPFLPRHLYQCMVPA